MSEDLSAYCVYVYVTVHMDPLREFGMLLTGKRWFLFLRGATFLHSGELHRGPSSAASYPEARLRTGLQPESSLLAHAAAEVSALPLHSISLSGSPRDDTRGIGE